MAGRTRGAKKPASVAIGSGNPFAWNETMAADNASPGSYQRGVDILGDVLSANLSASGVTGTVQGSGYAPYNVSIDANGSASCSCPDRRGGWCKHTCAVMVQALRGRTGASIASAATPAFVIGEPATKRRRTSTRAKAAPKKSAYNDYEDDESEESEFEEEEDDDDEEEEEVKPRKAVALNIVTPKIGIAPTTTLLTPFKTAMPAISPPASPLPGGVAATSASPSQPSGAAAQQLMQPWTGLALAVMQQVPMHAHRHHGGHNACSDCGRGLFGQPSVGRCTACNYHLCNDCDASGKGWHHVALSGGEHVVGRA